MTTPVSPGPPGGLTPPPAFDDGDTFDDLGVDGDAYLASLLDKAGGDLVADSKAALDDPDALAALVARRTAEESAAAQIDSLKASIAEKAKRVLDDPSPARVHNKTGVLGQTLIESVSASADARVLEASAPTKSPMSAQQKAAEREKQGAALARRRDASAKYGRVDPDVHVGAAPRRWPSKSANANERRLRELDDARKSYERRYPPAKIDAGGGLDLPARVDAQPTGPKHKENRAPQVTHQSRPWRHNPLASYDTTDTVSSSFNDTRRLKTLEKNRRVYGTKPTRRNDAKHKDGWKVDRGKYPSFKNWLSERKGDLIDEKRKNEELVARMQDRAEREKELRRQVREKKAAAKEAGGDGSDPAAVQLKDTEGANPALAKFLAMCDQFASGEDGLEEFVLDPAWRAAATKAIEAKAVEAAKEAAKAAVAAKERMVEDQLLMEKILAEEASRDEAALRGQVFETPPVDPVPLGPVETVMDGDVVLKQTEVAVEEEEEDTEEDVPPDPVIFSKEQMIADALASMTADERTAARAAACKGWKADFSGTFFKGTGTVSSKGSTHAKAPTWSEKPNPKPGEDSDIDSDIDVHDVDNLAVEFIGPNAADLAYAALHPNSELPSKPEAEHNDKAVVTTADEAVARGLVPKPGEPGFDIGKVKEVLECEFIGAGGDYMALQAVFPCASAPEVPGPPKRKKKVVEGKALKMHAERIKEGEFAMQTGVPQLAVEFIGANAEDLTAEAIKGYLNPRPVTEELNLCSGLNETMDEEELASFIAGDPVQGVVDLPPPRPPLLLAEIEKAEAAANEAALSTEELSKAQEVFETDNDAYAGEYYDDDVQDEFEEFEAEAEEIKTSRRNSENIVLGDLPVPENIDAGADSSHSGSGGDSPISDDSLLVTDATIADAIAKYSPIKQNDDDGLSAVRRLVNEGSNEGPMDTDKLRDAAEAMAKGEVVPPEAIVDAAKAMGVPDFGADWKESGRAAETKAAGGGDSKWLKVGAEEEANPWTGDASDETAPSKEEVLREGEALASKVDAVVEGGEVPDKDDAKPLLDGVKDRIGDAFNK